MILSLMRFPFAATLLAAGPAFATAPSSPEQALTAYVDGLRTGSVATLEALFLPDGQFCTLPDKSDAPVSCKRFAEVLASWAAHPDPAATGRVLDRRDATPSMTAVTYELHFGGDRYIDQLLLYRTDAGWRVVAKTTAVR